MSKRRELNAGSRWVLAFLVCTSLVACGGAVEDDTPEHEVALGRSSVAPLSSGALNEGVQGTGSVVAGLAAMSPAVTLATVATPAAATMSMVGPTSNCAVGFTPSAALLNAPAAAIAASSGATYSAADLANWRTRLNEGPFLIPSDYKAGSPGDRQRIYANADIFLREGEIVATEDNRAVNGMRARDAAFVFRVTGDVRMRDAVGRYLVAAARDPINNFATRCYRNLDGSAPAGNGDGWFSLAAWVLRHGVAYDYVRASLSVADRTTIETWLRVQAYFFAGHLDFNLQNIFPKRLAGDYSVRAGSASATTKLPYVTARMDTNGDCQVGVSDVVAEYPVYAYVGADRKFGPRISWLSQWFNNRRSNLAMTVGTVGLLLNDAVLIDRSKRYVMEWLTWAVYPDGSEGEFARNGNYCIPRQGVIYAQSNVQTGVMLAHWLKLRGDSSLVNFKTTQGLWGTASATSKSLEGVIATHLMLRTGTRAWYFAEPWRANQLPRADTHLGKMAANFAGQSSAVDTFHELGLLIAAPSFPAQPISAVIMRTGTYASLPFPTASRNRVDTGHGSWTDMRGALPAAYLLR